MNRLEFEAQLIAYAGEDNVRVFTEEEYSKIEFVYVWHPAIAAVGGKRQIAILWQEFGMGLINDMYPVAKDMKERENKRDALRSDLVNADKIIKEIHNRYR